MILCIFIAKTTCGQKLGYLLTFLVAEDVKQSHSGFPDISESCTNSGRPQAAANFFFCGWLDDFCGG